jgi:hypothetical protein
MIRFGRAARFPSGIPHPHFLGVAARISPVSDPAMNSALPELLRSRADSNERIHTYRVGEKLRKRLASYFDSGPQLAPTGEKNMEQKSGHTENFNRVLVSWLALQNAMSRVRRGRSEENETPLTPWDCDDKEVCRLWDEITRPSNLATLWEWLRQSASGEQEIWALQALQECQLRSEHESSR